MRWIGGLVVGLLLLLAVPANGQAPRYDIVLIVTDDQRWDTVKYMPTVSKELLGRGVSFLNAFVSTPLCCPSRASILTGLYTHNHGVLSNSPAEGGGAEAFHSATVASSLRKIGYRTALIGKYLNLYYRIAPEVPSDWSVWQVFNLESYYNYTLTLTDGTQEVHGTAPSEYSTGLLATRAVQFVATTPREQRIFLYFAPFAPHIDNSTRLAIPAPGDERAFSDLTPWRPPSHNEANTADKPYWIRRRAAMGRGQIAFLDEQRLSMLRALLGVDRAVQAILTALESSGRLDNTVIIFTSDNGYAWGEHRYQAKNCVYEECIRVPLIVRMPGVPARAERHLVENIDIAPTVAALAGVEWPADGRNLAPLLRNPVVSWRDDILLETFAQTIIQRFQAVRTERYVYARYPATGERELYDLVVDPYELHNVAGAGAYAAVEGDLRNRLSQIAGGSRSVESRTLAELGIPAAIAVWTLGVVLFAVTKAALRRVDLRQ